MVADHREPWNPDRRWADPLIALLTLLVVCLLAWRTHAEGRAQGAMPERISSQGRLLELRQAAKDLARSRAGGLFPAAALDRPEAPVTVPWDRALAAILAAEDGDLQPGRALGLASPFPGLEAYRRCYGAAYLAEAVFPEVTERRTVQEALRNGYAARLLEARLEALRTPDSAQQLREQARSWALPRLAGLALAGLALLVLVPSGIAMAILLALSPPHPRTFPVPRLRLSGRALALVFLGWFFAFLCSGLVVGPIIAQLTALRVVALPMAYGFHALVGLTLLCVLEGVGWRTLCRRLLPGAHLKSLAWGVGFLALALVMVLGVVLLLSPLLASQESPQRELMDLVAGSQGFLPVALLFLTVSVAAPVFEECLFRGTLLPWLGHRLVTFMGHRSGWAAALLLSGLSFGMIHLQPLAVPVLSTLGVALGLAFLYTRHLGTAILVHGLWNGGVFLFYRVVLG